MKKLIEVSSEFQKSFLYERQTYMGFAILLVVLYHLVCRFHLHGFGIAHVLGRGYVGVDVFLFFSGLGLCFSCTKNSLSQFYKNRVLRIMPLYIVLAIVSSLTYQIAEDNLTIWDWFCNLTTLSYYGLGGCFVDWYLSSLFVFYLFFPLVFKNVKGGGILLIGIISELIVLFVPMYWTYDCFVSRIGIFLLGVLYYRNRSDELFFLKSILISLLLFVLFVVVAHVMDFNLSRFLYMSLLTPFIMLIFFILISQAWMWQIKNALSYIGRYTLEIYIANCISWKVGVLLPSSLYNPWTDLLFTSIFAVLLFNVNRQCVLMLYKYRVK